jgi:hypothetical protein
MRCCQIGDEYLDLVFTSKSLEGITCNFNMMCKAASSCDGMR